MRKKGTLFELSIQRVKGQTTFTKGEKIQQCEKDMPNKDDPVITQIRPYEPIIKDKAIKKNLF